LRRDALDADGIICDIGRSLDLLQTVLAEFDYRNLDELAEFRGRKPLRSPGLRSPQAAGAAN
jgi:6-pyruvoyltetrahydropterin/6-carboxytetrahydropterin synthase